MNNLNNEKADVVSVILENNELLDAFADTLIIEEAEEDLPGIDTLPSYRWLRFSTAPVSAIRF